MLAPTEVRAYDVVVATGTTPAAPQVTGISMPAREVLAIRIRIPPGANGEVGFAVGVAGVPVYPTATGSWIIASDEIVEWQLLSTITSGAWQLLAYNTGTYVHTLHIEFVLRPVDADAGNAQPPPSVANLSGSYIPQGGDTLPSITAPPPPALPPLTFPGLPDISAPPAFTLPDAPVLPPAPSLPPMMPPPSLSGLPGDSTAGGPSGVIYTPAVPALLTSSARIALVRLAYLAALGREPDSGARAADWAAQIDGKGSNVDGVIATIADSTEGQLFRNSLRAAVAAKVPA